LECGGIAEIGETGTLDFEPRGPDPPDCRDRAVIGTDLPLSRDQGSDAPHPEALRASRKSDSANLKQGHL
jgi:hypothetical protein